MKKEIELKLQSARCGQYLENQLKFFKTEPGEYAAHDEFLGIRVPIVRKLAKEYFRDLSFDMLVTFLESAYHEYRMFALFVLVFQFEKADASKQKKVYNFYKKHFHCVNNWDLVDLSCYKIVGPYLYDLGKGEQLLKFAKSKDLWIRRIGIVSTYAYIKRQSIDIVFDVSDLLLEDSQDLIHKAVGWMLREAGKVDFSALEQYLVKNIKKLPRLTLRYAIERFDAKKRKELLAL